jgi:hypothetical protein
MAAEWLGIAKGVTSIAEKIFSGLSKYEKLQASERKRVAALLDHIAKDVLAIAKQMNKKDTPEDICAKVLAYGQQLPRLIERVYDKEIADQEGPNGIWRVRRGDAVPGLGRIDSIVLWGQRWIVATSQGLISTP